MFLCSFVICCFFLNSFLFAVGKVTLEVVDVEEDDCKQNVDLW